MSHFEASERHDHAEREPDVTRAAARDFHKFHAAAASVPAASAAIGAPHLSNNPQARMQDPKKYFHLIAISSPTLRSPSLPAGHSLDLQAVWSTRCAGSLRG